MEEKRVFLEQAREVLGAALRRKSAGFLTVEHPNGFKKILLGSDSSPWEYRIHQWRPNAISDIHSHTSHFRSMLLSGEMTEDLYAELPGVGFRRVDVRSDDASGSFDFSRAHRCSLTLVQSEAAVCGDFRAIDISTPHRVRVGSTGAVTLVGKSRATREFSQAYWTESQFAVRQQRQRIVPVYKNLSRDLIDDVIRTIDEHAYA